MLFAGLHLFVVSKYYFSCSNKIIIYLIQLSAQVMTKRGYNFFTVNTTKEPKLRKQEGRQSAVFVN